MATEVPPVEGAQPSRDPANDGTVLGTLNQVMKKMMQGMDDCLPAQVIAFDRTSNRATVQPLVKVLATNGQTVSRAQIASVPVFQIGGGGFMLNFNLKAGDLGWIKACDRDTSLYLQGCSEQHPNTNRIHSFSDGLFFPQIMQGFTIDPEDAENAVWQTLDGSVRVALWPEKVKITAPEVHVVAPLVNVESQTVTVVADTVTIDAPQTTLTGDLQVDGNINTGSNVTADGDMTADGTVTGTTNVKAGTKLLKAHTHGTGAVTAFTTLDNN